MPISQSKKCIPLVLMSLLWGSSSGQGFDRTYATPNVDDGAQVLINSPDGNFLVGGYRRDSAFVMMMDPFGGPIWSKTFQPVASYANCVYHLDLTPDGYLIGCGNALGGSPLGPIASFFFKFDLAGNLLWTSRSSIGSQLWTSRSGGPGHGIHGTFAGAADERHLQRYHHQQIERCFRLVDMAIAQIGPSAIIAIHR
jgi:hypothetical protein